MSGNNPPRGLNTQNSGECYNCFADRKWLQHEHYPEVSGDKLWHGYKKEKPGSEMQELKGYILRLRGKTHINSKQNQFK